MTEKRNGCHNRKPFKPEMELRHLAMVDEDMGDGVSRKVVREVVTVIPFRMAYDCRYSLSDMGQIDAGCDGCKWRQQP